MNSSDHLKLIFILCSICLRQDTLELKSFIRVNSLHVDTNDFNKILRKVIKLLEFKKCGDTACPDWLMNELFKLYKIDEVV